MVENFVKIKKREGIRLGVFSGVVGVSGAVLTFGILLTVFKLQQRAFAWYWYLLCSLGVGLLLSGALLLCFYPSTKRLAKKLDKRYSLEEKVQTMVEYSAKQGAIVQLQREDTDRALATLPKPKRSFLSLLKIGAMPLLAAVMLTVSLVIPNKEIAQEPVAPPASAEETLDRVEALSALQELIKNVKGAKWRKNDASVWDTTLKSGYVTALETLQVLVEDEEATEEEIQGYAQITMGLIFDLTNSENTYKIFVKEILADTEASVKLKDLSDLLLGSGNVYKSFKPSVKIDLFSSVNAQNDKITDDVEAKTGAYKAMATSTIDESGQEACVTFLTEYTTLLDKILATEAVVAISEKNALKADLAKLATGWKKTLDDFLTMPEYFPLNAMKNTINQIMTAFEGGGASGAIAFVGLKNTLAEQAYSELMKDYVLKTLHGIFGGVIPQDSVVGSGQEGGNGDDNQGGGGGGDGALKFPGQGQILNPNPQEGESYFEDYTKLLMRYNNDVNSILGDESREIPEELKSFITAYFSSLY